MDCKAKVTWLRTKIEQSLTPLITNEYLYLDLPYHANLGDTLIWQGTLDYLKDLPYRCLMSTCTFGRSFMAVACHHPEAIILLHGGGNFGDMWPSSNDYRKEVIKSLPGRKIIVLPQTIFYNDESNLQTDAMFYAQHPNVTICVRDAVSFDLVKKHFPNNPSLLVPDMAFCMNVERCLRRQHAGEGNLFVKRVDKELSRTVDYDCVPHGSFISDWPTFMGNNFWEYRLIGKFNPYGNALDCRLHIDLWHRLSDWYWQNVIRPKNIARAINFIGSYNHIYTTRLHAAILSVILQRPAITVFNNSYGKNASFVETWLGDIDGLRLIK